MQNKKLELESIVGNIVYSYSKNLKSLLICGASSSRGKNLRAKEEIRKLKEILKFNLNVELSKCSLLKEVDVDEYDELRKIIQPVFQYHFTLIKKLSQEIDRKLNS